MSPFRIVCAAAIVLAVSSTAPFASGRSVSIIGYGARDGWIEVDLELRGAFSGKVRETLERGVPASVEYRFELVRHRPGWFDESLGEYILFFNIEYDVWENVYRVTKKNGRVRDPLLYPIEHASLDRLVEDVCHPKGLWMARLDDLEKDRNHYFRLKVEIKPLELKQIRKIEAWLDGKIPGDEERGGGILGIPERLYGFVSSVAGFEKEVFQFEWRDFDPDDLEDREEFPPDSDSHPPE